MPNSLSPPPLARAVHQRDVVPEHRQPVGAGEAGGAGADHGDAPAGRRGAGEGVAALRPSACRWRSAAAGRSRPGGPRRPRARRPPRRASRSGRPARTCRRGCSGRGSCAPPPRATPVAISRMNSGMSIEVGQAVDAGRVVAEVAAVGGDQRLVRRERRGDVGEVRRQRLGASRPPTIPGVCGLGAMDLSVLPAAARCHSSYFLSNGKICRGCAADARPRLNSADAARSRPRSVTAARPRPRRGRGVPARRQRSARPALPAGLRQGAAAAHPRARCPRRC